MQYRLAAALFLAVGLTISLGRANESWGQAKSPRVGMLIRPLMSASSRDLWYERFPATLAQKGWSEGKNVSFEYRSMRGEPPQYDDSAAELVKLKSRCHCGQQRPCYSGGVGSNAHHPDRRARFHQRPGGCRVCRELRSTRAQSHRVLSGRTGVRGQMGRAAQGNRSGALTSRRPLGPQPGGHASASSARCGEIVRHPASGC